MSARALAGALCLLLLASTGAPAQPTRADPTDLQAWYALGLGIDLPSRWEADLRFRVRTENNASSYRGAYLTAELGRELIDGITALGGYRLARVDDATFHRFSAGMQGELRAGAATLSLRPLLQYQQKVFANDADGGETSTLLRTRARARYRLNRSVALHASAEPHFNFGDGYLIDNLRNTIGMTVRDGSGRRINLFYIYRPDFAKSYNRVFHVVGVDLDFEIRPFRGR